MDKNLDLVRRCLTLISRIAARDASSSDPQDVSDFLAELTCALQRYPYAYGTLEPPISAKGIYSLQRLLEALDYTDSTSREYTASDFLRFANTSTWN
jgi:hypothetical protein